MIPAISGAIGPMGAGEWSVGSIGSIGGAGATTAPPTGTGSGSFSSALTSALGGLETTQADATTASEQLATGQLSDPTQAVTAVENASLSMDLASQVSNKLTTAATTLFQTQV
jgi:flagellar hook-basal body complex protein FliE